MQKKWLAIAVSAAFLGALAAGCGDDDEPTPDAAIDGRVADGSPVDAPPVDAPSPDAAMATHGATNVVSELHVYTGLNAFVTTASAAIAWNSVTAVPAAAVKTGNPLISPVGQCIGLSFNLAGGVAPNPNSGNAGNVTITGHRYNGAGCTPNGGVNPPQGCIPGATITCTRVGTGAATMPYTYDCGLPVVAGGTDNTPINLNDFMDATAPAALTIATAGGTDYGAVSRNVTAAPSADMDMATRLAIATTQIWNGTVGFTATLEGGAAPTVNILRIEMSNGDPTQAGGTGTATCNLVDRSFPNLTRCNATRYAVLTCAKTPLQGSTNTNTATAAQIMATFSDILPTATVVRVTNIGTGAPAQDVLMPGTSGAPNRATFGAGQGSVFFDTTPRTP